MRLLFFFRVSQPAQLTLDTAGQYRRADGRLASCTEISVFQASQTCVKEPTGLKDLITLMSGQPPTNPAPAVDEPSPQQPAAQEYQLEFSPKMVAAIMATLKASHHLAPQLNHALSIQRPLSLSRSSARASPRRTSGGLTPSRGTSSCLAHGVRTTSTSSPRILLRTPLSLGMSLSSTLMCGRTVSTTPSIRCIAPGCAHLSTAGTSSIAPTVPRTSRSSKSALKSSLSP
jgi:hypothetical protein